MEELKEGWRRVKLGEVAEILNGYAFKANDFKEIGVPVIKIKNITPPKVKLEDVQFVSEELYNEKIKYSLIYNDILISMTGSHASQPNSVVGRVARIKEINRKALLNQRVGKIYPKNEECNQSFLYYYLSQDFIKFELAASAGGSASQANINHNQIKELEISFPPLETQEKIASILSALDDKIEINNEMNKTLEEMAQTLFKRWFIDFDFPNENGEPYRSSGGKMIDSELGEIPEGWEVGAIKEIGEVITGKTPSTKNKENYGGKIPFITIPDMHGNIFITNTERYLSEIGNRTQSKKLLPVNSIIVSCIATVGLVSLNIRPSHTNQQINSIVPKSQNTLFYFFNVIKKLEDKLKMIGSAGTTTLNVNKGTFENIRIVFPNLKLMETYNNFVKNMYLKINENQQEIQSLTEIRDALLPKLMSGEVEV